MAGFSTSRAAHCSSHSSTVRRSAASHCDILDRPPAVSGSALRCAQSLPRRTARRAAVQHCRPSCPAISIAELPPLQSHLHLGGSAAQGERSGCKLSCQLESQLRSPVRLSELVTVIRARLRLCDQTMLQPRASTLWEQSSSEPQRASSLIRIKKEKRSGHNTRSSFFFPTLDHSVASAWELSGGLHFSCGGGRADVDDCEAQGGWQA